MKQEFFNDVVIDPAHGIRVIYEVFVPNEINPPISVDINKSNITSSQASRLQHNFYPDES